MRVLTAFAGITVFCWVGCGTHWHVRATVCVSSGDVFIGFFHSVCVHMQNTFMKKMLQFVCRPFSLMNEFACEFFYGDSRLKIYFW